jgi:hypothetical protein
MSVPNVFANATTSIPLVQLDQNFNTGITLGNTTVYLGNTTTSFGNVTLTGADVNGTVTLTTPLAVTSGGTGRATGTTAYGLIAAGTTATGAQQTLAAGATTEILVGGGASALPVWTTASGTGAPARVGSPTFTGTVSASAITASGAITSNSNIVVNGGGMTTGTANIVLDFRAVNSSAANMIFGSDLYGTDTGIKVGQIGSGATGIRCGGGLSMWNGSTIAGASGGINIDNSGNTQVTGSLSKGSGSFLIDHPLPALNKTHHLVHSFIEGPQADLIYRGKTTLVAGKASVDIDAAANMTEGTFELLCRDVQCFTSNETDWNHVRGSVSGNILRIECQDQTSTATISWMVIGERKDQHMLETEWTDVNGKVIVEPLKPAPIKLESK